MKVMKAIETADALCPNSYTLEEKLSWCDEVNAYIRRNILKKYDTIETCVDGSGYVTLPDDIPFERIENIFCDGKLMTKQDFRSYFSESTKESSLTGPVNLRAVYLTIPERIRYIDIRGKFNTGENYIEMSLSPFRVGDMIEICELSKEDDEADFEKSKTAFVTEACVDKIVLDSDVLSPVTENSLALRRVIDDVTEADEAPYDSGYIEYILAKIALYQHDYVSYDAHMTQYNYILEMLRRDARTRSPLTEQVRFKNYSVV